MIRLFVSLAVFVLVLNAAVLAFLLTRYYVESRNNA